MAAPRSKSRKSASTKTRKTRKSQTAARKPSKTRKQRLAGKKAAARRKKPAAIKKALVTAKTKAPIATRAKTTVTLATLPQQGRTPAARPAIAEIDSRIAITRDNLRGLVEQAASLSGASDDDLMSQRIAEQEAKLELLKKQREDLLR